ncbi:ABC transporter permease [Ureibacillus chungkukjangi]|uniref:Carbohydrate ABC transporter membrane protein 1 (CUT1 family) n=1 Tax=Ureibacillus chungkukjangi TaxID=1202712 RepID=A0A318U197_9BACL|nr:ABC transporter permease subunit [Ureibacillus chungkukjangi]MCM3387496.1 ABC transporter permease subunit [Ureibacillus chungkukjangi]PYF09018.1 carbohydrate ABC transporter membrane protein 1 (CUT1 family) [Ureibacillus chungkukjangi]
MRKISSLKRIRKDWILYLMLLPGMLYFVIFHIIPIVNMKLAFQDYRIIGENVWVGMKHFEQLFSSPAFKDVLMNTVIISTMKIIFIFPIPILVSLLVNELRFGPYRKYVQSVSYLPHFLSWVVIAGIWITLLNPVNGGVNVIRDFFQLPSLDYMTSKEHIRWVLVYSEMWRSAGWDSILYLAAILKINPSLYEAARIDGASTLQQMRYITLPALMSTVVTLFILNLGFFMSAGFDQVFNLMNDSVLSVIDILDTYVYRIGILNGQYSYATAAGLFKGVIGLVLILGTHFLSKRLTGKGVW